MTNYDFLVETISTPTDDCLVWPRGQNGHGYGRLVVKGKKFLAHVFALELTKPRPEGKVCSIKGLWVDGRRLDAAHGPCHNRLCFNPGHLSWKTRAENLADRDRDGTMTLGDSHGSTVVPDVDVAFMRSLYKGPRRGPDRTGPTHEELAERFGCSRPHVTAILNGVWRRGA